MAKITDDAQREITAIAGKVVDNLRQAPPARPSLRYSSAHALETAGIATISNVFGAAAGAPLTPGRRNRGFTSFTWNYESGLVAGAVPFATDATTAVDLTGFTADEQAQIGLTCGGVRATLNAGFGSCAPNLLRASLVRIPAPGTENDDKNPPRIAPRHLFNVGIGFNNVFHTEKQKMALRFTVTNLTNKVALYNFESTFSGTHFVSPRAYQEEVAYTF